MLDFLNRLGPHLVRGLRPTEVLDLDEEIGREDNATIAAVETAAAATDADGTSYPHLGSTVMDAMDQEDDAGDEPSDGEPVITSLPISPLPIDEVVDHAGPSNHPADDGLPSVKDKNYLKRIATIKYWIKAIVWGESMMMLRSSTQELTSGQALTRERLFKTLMEHRLREEINARDEGLEDAHKHPSVYLDDATKRKFGRWIWEKTCSG